MQYTTADSANFCAFEIIDMHNHVFPDRIALRGAESIRDYYELPLLGDGTLRTLLKSADAYNVRRIVICSAALKAEKIHTANEFTASQREKDARIIALGTTHAEAEDQAEVFHQIEALSLNGVKIHPEFQGFAVDDERLFEAWREAERLGLPVLFHIGDPKSDLSSPERLFRVMERFPNLKVIAAHMGGYQMKEEAECLVGTHCYFDTSQWFNYLTEKEFLHRIERHGVDRIMYGSDYPLNVPKNEIERLLEIDFSPEDRRKIFYENAKRVFQIQ